MPHLDLLVTDTTGHQLARPITSGVPIAEGVAPEGTRFNLRDAGGQAVPVQAAVLARWKDGSARWVLLDFQAAPPASGQARYRLTWDEGGPAAAPAVPAEASAGAISAGALTISTAEDALLTITGGLQVIFTAEDAKGTIFRAIADAVEVETAGPLRATLAMRGAFRDEAGRRWFGFRLRASVFAGLSRLFLEPMILIDAEQGVIQRVRELSLRIVTPGGTARASLGGNSAARLFQIDDMQYEVDGVRREGKAPGWAQAGAVAVAMRDFWQQWPKSLEMDGDTLAVGLFPHFTAGAFAHLEPWYKHDYLFDSDCYRLRTGQSRRWQLWLDPAGDGPELSAAANAPLLAAAEPAQAIAAGAWVGLTPSGPATADYDAWVENLFHGYCNAVAVERDYGAMNWGDWWGERGCNWGNQEYDTQRQILQQYARTGDPHYFYVGETAARHHAEVDVIHAVNADLIRYFEEEMPVKNPNYPIRAGMVHEHCVGHVGGFYPVPQIRELFVSLGIGKTDNPYLCLDPYNLGHIFTQGMMYHYFLTGDPWVKETLETIGENLARLVEDRRFQYFRGEAHSGRVNGWTMLALAGVYEMDFDDRYLRAMQLLADDALEEQDPNCGGWLYELPWGHCFCTSRKHVGEAGFITAVRLNGLSRYYELTGDPRIPAALRRGVTHLNNDTWKEERSAWRYTSCPATKPSGQPGVTIMALANSVRITGDPEHLRILRKAWEAKFARLQAEPAAAPGAGKTFSSSVYGCPEAMSLMEALAPEEVGGKK
jgi:hypothetical protein